MKKTGVSHTHPLDSTTGSLYTSIEMFFSCLNLRILLLISLRKMKTFLPKSFIFQIDRYLSTPLWVGGWVKKDGYAREDLDVQLAVITGCNLHLQSLKRPELYPVFADMFFFGLEKSQKYLL